MRVLTFLAILMLMTTARAQHHHERHHANYQNWINKLDKGCCNNEDCGELADGNERTDGGVLAVRIEGEWCPVLPHHYLKQGNVPDASTSHVCVQKPSAAGPASPCARLLCYQPKPGS